MKFEAYIRLEQLADDVKRANKVKVGAKVPRYDVTATAGYYKPLEALTNAKGMCILYLNETRGVITSPDARRADRFLMGRAGKDSVNVSSVYLLNPDTEGSTAADTAAEGSIVGYGNPNGFHILKSGNPNPFYGSGHDGFLFLISPDWRLIEWLVVPDGVNTILGNAKAMADGVYNEALQTMRAAATTYYDYWL